MVNKQWLGPDMEGNGRGLITHYSGISLVEDHEKRQPEWPVSRLKNEPGTAD
jgi:hypothetical protein